MTQEQFAQLTAGQLVNLNYKGNKVRAAIQAVGGNTVFFSLRNKSTGKKFTIVVGAWEMRIGANGSVFAKV